LDITSNLLVESYRYYGYYDLLSSLGGIKAVFAPLFEFFTPILVLFFFYKLSRMLKAKAKFNYEIQLTESISEIIGKLDEDQAF
jgi:hypothetical protein